MPKLLDRPTLPKPTDPDLIERFSGAVALGHPITTASTLAGISRRTADYWIAQGEAELEQAEVTGEEPGSHVPFVLAFKQAQATFCDVHLQVVGGAALGKNGWLPAMTLLERRMPQDFGRRTEVSVKSESVVVHVTGTLSEATQAKVWEIAARAQKALPPPSVNTPES